MFSIELFHPVEKDSNKNSTDFVILKDLRTLDYLERPMSHCLGCDCTEFCRCKRGTC